MELEIKLLVMPKIKISFFEIKERWQRELFEKTFSPASFVLQFNPGKLTVGNAGKYKASDAIVVFIHCKVDKKVLEKLPRLKFVATQSTGFDHIDLAAAKSRGVTVCNVPFYGENTVAEHSFALILSLSRKIVESANRTRAGKFGLEGLRGFDLKDKVIGVVGAGHIGRHVIRMAHGFEMKMLAYDPYPDKSLESHYPLQYVSLEKLLTASDIISLHAPYGPRTHHLINTKNIRLVKKGAILINTARGGLVETAALLAALKSGRLAAAGLDVLEEEGLISEDSGLVAGYLEREKLATVLADHRLLTMQNVLVTPHNAFNSHEAVLRIATTTVENIKVWKKGKPINIVS
ncbi:MAG: hydroxyacid dehydrogenase [bacterium]|nr:hydroxyacid dehydrogenase [bacterium]